MRNIKDAPGRKAMLQEAEKSYLANKIERERKLREVRKAWADKHGYDYHLADYVDSLLEAYQVLLGCDTDNSLSPRVTEIYYELLSELS